MNASQMLLGLIITMFFAQVISFDLVTRLFYLDPSRVLFEPWMFVTSIFFHGSVMHLFFNGYALFVFGSILEQRVGTRNFLVLFFLSGIAGNLLYYLTVMLGIIPPIPSLGASGAIYGILGALAVLVPELVLLVFFFVPMPIRLVVILWFVMEFLVMFDSSSGIASAAHLGGLIVGLAFGKLIHDSEWKAYKYYYR